MMDGMIPSYTESEGGGAGRRGQGGIDKQGGDRRSGRRSRRTRPHGDGDAESGREDRP